MSWQVLSMLCLSSLSFVGCVSRDIDDLALVSVHEVAYPSQDQVWGGLDNPERFSPLIKVRFSSKWDLARYISENHYSIQSKSYFCGRPEDYVILSLPKVYANGVEITDIYNVSDSNIGDNPGSKVVEYNVYLSTFREGSANSRPPQIGFNLIEKAEDVCLYLIGGGEHSGFKSNTITIYKNYLEGVVRTE